MLEAAIQELEDMFHLYLIVPMSRYITSTQLGRELYPMDPCNTQEILLIQILMLRLLMLQLLTHLFPMVQLLMLLFLMLQHLLFLML